jgi:hypothetical protein
MSEEAMRGQEGEPITDRPLSAADASLGLLALSQLPAPTAAEFRALLGPETAENLAMVIQASIRLIHELTASVAAAHGIPVERLVADLRKAMFNN